MYNAKAVILGILVFAVLFSTPFWANFCLLYTSRCV